MKGLSVDVEQLVHFQELISRYLESVSTSLSKYFNDKVSFDLEKFYLVSSEQLDNITQDAKDEMVQAACIKTDDEIDSEFIFIIKQNDLEKLWKKISESFKVSIPKYSGSIFAETCNIITGSFLNDVCNTTGIVTVPKPPVISNDYHSPILNSCMIEIMDNFETVFFIQCKFLIADCFVIESMIVLDSNDTQRISELSSDD